MSTRNPWDFIHSTEIIDYWRAIELNGLTNFYTIRSGDYEISIRSIRRILSGIYIHFILYDRITHRSAYMHISMHSTSGGSSQMHLQIDNLDDVRQSLQLRIDYFHKRYHIYVGYHGIGFHNSWDFIDNAVDEGYIPFNVNRNVVDDCIIPLINHLFTQLSINPITPIDNVLNRTMSYQQKYLKYKQKYLKLKKMLENNIN